MKLYEMDADRILAELERRGEEYVSAKERATLDEAHHDRLKASIYSAIRKAGGVSIDDAKAQALNSDSVVEAFTQWAESEREKDRAYLALERAREAVRLYQTVRSDMRRV